MGSADCGDGTAEGVASRDDSVGRIAGQGAVDGGNDRGGDLFPGELEARVHGAARREARGAVCVAKVEALSVRVSGWGGWLLRDWARRCHTW